MTLRITGGEHRGRRLKTARSRDLRPTSDRVRSAIFSILGAEAVEGARALDLYAGTGALGIEALSRGAEYVDFVEANGRRSRELLDSLKALGLADKATVHTGQVERVLGSLGGGYRLVFADPPYALDPWESLMAALNANGLLEEECVVVLEHGRDTEPIDAYGRLELVTRRRYGDTSISIYRAGATDD